MIIKIDMDKLQKRLNKCGVILFINQKISKIYEGDGPMINARSKNLYELSCNIQGTIADESASMHINPIQYEPNTDFPPEHIRDEAYEKLLIDLIMYGATYLRVHNGKRITEDRT